MSFSANISTWIAKTRLSRDTVVRKLALDAFAGILRRSPVDTGRFRSSHRLGINQADLSVSEERSGGVAESSPYPGGLELSKARSDLARAKFGDTIHITNNLPYAQPLEDGSSGQTNKEPGGIYQATFDEISAKLERTIRTARVP